MFRPFTHTLALLALALPAAQARALADIDDVLQPVLMRHKVPALAGAIVTSKGPVAVAAVGVRKAGTGVKVTAGDRWHLGSETKAMTAHVIAALVERGRLKWETTLTDSFPEMAESFWPTLRKATLAQLLSHRSGLVENLAWNAIPPGSAREQREAAVRMLAKAPRRFDPGADFLYSNTGYVVAGAMAERASGASWEELMARTLFEPLAMRSAGFGGTGTPGKIDQPWPHLENGRPASTNGPAADNPPVIGPAGTVHASIVDWGRFIADHLKGARGERALLSPLSYKRLHAPAPGGNYAMGWVALDREWAGGPVLTHAGSNTLNYCVVWMAPKINVAALACTNQGGPVAARATEDAVAAMVRYHQR